MTDQPREPSLGRSRGPDWQGPEWTRPDWDGPEPEEPTDAELLGMWPDPFAGAPDCDDAWLADLSVAVDPVAVDPIPAGLGWRAPIDVLPPDEVLAGFAAEAYDGGLGRLSDDELIGLLCASRRLSSWQAAVELGVVSELDGRRRSRAERADSGRVGEQVSAELALALTLTSRSADALLCLARDLRRLPAVFAALFAGQIDRAKALVFATELAAVSDKVAAAIVMALIGAAASMTTGQLRAELKALVLTIEPGAVRRRAEKAREDSRVETWQENSGNWGIAGRELPAAEVITADKRLTAIARALKTAGAEGNIDQLRAAVMVALLNGRDPESLVPGRSVKPVPASSGGIAGLTGSVNLTVPLATWLGSSDAPGEVAGLGPVDADACRELAGRLAAGPGAKWCVTLTDGDGRAAAHACARRAPDRPGDGRDDGSGARGRPAARGSPDYVAWLASLKFEWLERGECGHRRQGPSYRPSGLLRHLVSIRQRTCGHPGCRRPAEECDCDHTVPYLRGGRTCECNLGPFCRRHHQIKQVRGWRVEQPEPGVLIWTAPHGRSYTSRPDRYPG